MTTKICKQPNCTRTEYSVGMCRPCREHALHGRRKPEVHKVGEARARVEELVEHYGNTGTVANAVGVGRGTITRVLTVSAHEPLKVTAFERIMNHVPVADAVAPVTRAVVAEYATTPEGEAFVTRCRLPRKYRQEVAA